MWTMDLVDKFSGQVQCESYANFDNYLEACRFGDAHWREWASNGWYYVVRRLAF